MKKNSKKTSRQHHFWIHFWCGLVLGGFLSFWMAITTFNETWELVTATVVIALLVAYACGRWGDPVWHWIINHWH